MRSQFFQAIYNIDSFALAGRVIILDQDKSMDKSYWQKRSKSKLFLDVLHVKKNMYTEICSEKV